MLAELKQKAGCESGIRNRRIKSYETKINDLNDEGCHAIAWRSFFVSKYTAGVLYSENGIDRITHLYYCINRVIQF